MSHPAICIAPQGTTPYVPPRYIPCDLAGIIPKSVSGSCDLMVRYSKIPHTPYGIRNSEIGIPEPGYRKSSWCGIFPLDHEEGCAVGWSPNNENENNDDETTRDQRRGAGWPHGALEERWVRGDPRQSGPMVHHVPLEWIA